MQVITYNINTLQLHLKRNKTTSDTLTDVLMNKSLLVYVVFSISAQRCNVCTFLILCDVLNSIFKVDIAQSLRSYQKIPANMLKQTCFSRNYKHTKFAGHRNLIN